MSEAPGRIAALLYDGISSRAQAVDIELTAGGARLGDVPLGPPFVRRIVEPVGGMPWMFELADGRLIEADRASGQRLAQALGHRGSRIARWERSLLLVLTAIPILIFAVYVIASDGMPFLADRAALALPRSADGLTGAQALAAFDSLSAPSRVPAPRQAALRARFAEMARQILGSSGAARLEFRDSPAIGPNAFALPGGVVVVTDQLAALLTDDEVMAVLAHETGHVLNRHVIRLAFRSSGLAVMAGVLIGDATTVGNVLAGLPVLALQLSFSRDFENQADDVAYRWLSAPGRSTCDFAGALTKIEQFVARRATAAGSDRLPDWLSTHPGTEERIARFRASCTRQGSHAHTI